MQQLAAEEREVLEKKYSEGYRFIARDKDDELFGFKKEPKKENTIWYSGLFFCYLNSNPSFLKFIKWEDNKPHEIKKLLEDDNNTKIEHAGHFPAEKFGG